MTSSSSGRRSPEATAARLLRGVAKDTRKTCKAVLKQGWHLEHGGNHVLLVSADGHHRIPVPGPSACSTSGLLRAWKLQLRKAGVQGV